jgi:hypothetical protein
VASTFTEKGEVEYASVGIIKEEITMLYKTYTRTLNDSTSKLRRWFYQVPLHYTTTSWAFVLTYPSRALLLRWTHRPGKQVDRSRPQEEVDPKYYILLVITITVVSITMQQLFRISLQNPICRRRSTSRTMFYVGTH